MADFAIATFEDLSGEAEAVAEYLEAPIISPWAGLGLKNELMKVFADLRQTIEVLGGTTTTDGEDFVAEAVPRELFHQSKGMYLISLIPPIPIRFAEYRAPPISGGVRRLLASVHHSHPSSVSRQICACAVNSRAQQLCDTASNPRAVMGKEAYGPRNLSSPVDHRGVPVALLSLDLTLSPRRDARASLIPSIVVHPTSPSSSPPTRPRLSRNDRSASVLLKRAGHSVSHQRTSNCK
jgi:hypothetical protein